MRWCGLLPYYPNVDVIHHHHPSIIMYSFLFMCPIVVVVVVVVVVVDILLLLIGYFPPLCVLTLMSSWSIYLTYLLSPPLLVSRRKD